MPWSCECGMKNSGFMPICEQCSRPREEVDAMEVDCAISKNDEQNDVSTAALAITRKRERQPDEATGAVVSAASKRPRRFQGEYESS